MWIRSSRGRDLRRIVDRSREHLGTSDVGIIRARKRLLEAALRLRHHGEEPRGVRDPCAYRRRGRQLVLPRDVDWIEASEAEQRC